MPNQKAQFEYSNICNEVPWCVPKFTQFLNKYEHDIQQLNFGSSYIKNKFVLNLILTEHFCFSFTLL